MVNNEFSINLIHTFIFPISRLPWHLDKKFYTVFHNPAQAKFKKNILESKLAYWYTKKVPLYYIRLHSISIKVNQILGCLGSWENVKTKACSKLFSTSKKTFQIWHYHYIFIISFSNFNPRIKILLTLDSAKAGLLKNVQNHILRCFGSREIEETKVGTFFLNTL